jgi:hypothetical protein
MLSEALNQHQLPEASSTSFDINIDYMRKISNKKRDHHDYKQQVFE